MLMSLCHVQMIFAEYRSKIDVGYCSVLWERMGSLRCLGLQLRVSGSATS